MDRPHECSHMSDSVLHVTHRMLYFSQPSSETVSPMRRSTRSPSWVARKTQQTLVLLAVWWGIGAPVNLGAQSEDVFRAFTAHIEQQIEADKRTFLGAQTCTEWFYKRHRQEQRLPRADRASLRPLDFTQHQALQPSECRTRYPHGLEGAREDFSRTQSSLSVSLTFYQFALVGDRNDDELYSGAELRDMLESLHVPFDSLLPQALHLAALTTKFDAARGGSSAESVMNGMGTLYEKGYRLTRQDLTALRRIAG